MYIFTEKMKERRLHYEIISVPIHPELSSHVLFLFSLLRGRQGTDKQSEWDGEFLGALHSLQGGASSGMLTHEISEKTSQLPPSGFLEVRLCEVVIFSAWDTVCTTHVQP